MDFNLLFTLLAVPEIHTTKFKQPRLKSQPEGRFYIEDPLVLGISISSVVPFLLIHTNWVTGATTGHFQNPY